MASRVLISSLDSIMSSLINNTPQQEIQGWKLEINHDGPILNWYSFPNPQSSPENPSLSESNSELNSKSKINLFDYLYVVSDGVIFSGK
jgi:hypothetical protein